MSKIPTRWHPTSTSQSTSQKTTYTTPFDPIEKITHYYARINPHLTQWTISCGVTLPSTAAAYTIQQIKSAWIKLRYNHPIIAAKVSSDGKGLEYSVPGSLRDVYEWADETVVLVDDNSGGVSGREVYKGLEAPGSARVYWIPGRNELFLHLPHEVSDGIGSIILLNNLLENLKMLGEGNDDNVVGEEGYIVGEEVGRLPPSLFDILGVDWKSGTGLDGEELKQADIIADKFLGNDSIALKIKDRITADTAVPTLPSGRVEYTFSKQETERIVTACKRMGVTVTNAVMAANGLYMLEVSEEEGKKKGRLSNLVSVNLRPRMEEPYERLAGGNMFVDTFSVFEVLGGETDTQDGGEKKKRKKKEFIELAREIKTELTAWKNEAEYITYTPHLVNKLEIAAKRAVEEGVLGNSGFVISSLGVVEKYLQQDVEDFWFGIGVASVGAGCFFVWTVKGQLRIAVCYNEVWFEEGVVEGFVEGVVGELRRGLQLTG